MNLSVLLALAHLGTSPTPVPPPLNPSLANPKDPDAPMVAFRIPEGEQVRIDGRLDEAVWTLAEAITDFTQREPVEGGCRPSGRRSA